MVKAIKVANELYRNYKIINKEVPRLNSGGCGVFAEHLYLTLIKLGLKPILGVITTNRKGMEERIRAWDLLGERADSFNCNWSSNDEDGWWNWQDEYGYACVEHVVIILKGKLIDSEGLYSNVREHNDPYYHKMSLVDTLSIEVLKNWNREGTFWNSSFNREKGVKAVEKRLKVCYTKVKKSLAVSK